METTLTPQSTPPSTTPSRRRKITKFGLAAVAVLGVGAALTSAAWSDNVWFGGTATAAKFELSGSVDTIDWVAGSTSSVSIQLPADTLKAIGPNVSDEVVVYVRNDGDIPVYLKPAVVAHPGLLGKINTSVVYGAQSLAPDAWTTVTVTVTGTGNLQQSDSVPISIRVEGSSSQP
jgi:predicted ribosomally synthesized peptide with SipW-like signal peptide